MITKPKMSSSELIEKMKSKGITFNLMGEEEASAYLKEHNNYFRIASYRKNYDKRLLGNKTGEYIGLDFAYLSELATIDMHLRFLVIKMCLDIEHSLKVTMLSDIAENNDDEDGYNIVKSFLEKNQFVLKDIFSKRYAAYVSGIIKDSFTFDCHTSNNKNTILDDIDIHCPVWAFMEIIGFGEFIKFYDYYYGYYQQKRNYINVLNLVKSLRNACAHNNCIIHDLRKGSCKYSHEISDFVSGICTISKSERKDKLTIRPLLEITALIYVYENTVFEPVKHHRYNELKSLVNERMVKHADYFRDQQIISSSYNFIKKVVDFLQ